MKAYERVYDPPRLPKNDYIMARLDGCCFSTFTQHFVKPYDGVLAQAMAITAADLLDKFNATLAYTFSDEITLVWVPEQHRDDTDKIFYKDLPYGGKVLKWSTVLASFASTSFNKRLAEEIDGWEDRHDPRMISVIKHESAVFDARIFSVPDEMEVMNNLIWRARDCWRNNVHGLARRYFSQEELHCKDTPRQLEMLKERGSNFHEWIPEFKYGVVLKHKQMHLHNQDGEEYTRRRVCAFSLNIKDDAHNYTKELLDKYTTRQQVQIVF